MVSYDVMIAVPIKIGAELYNKTLPEAQFAICSRFIFFHKLSIFPPLYFEIRLHAFPIAFAETKIHAITNFNKYRK